MNYEANTKDWAIGDIVIHDADAMKPFMLMIVLGKRKNGKIGTRYIYPGLIWNKHRNVPYREMPKRMQKHYGKMWWNEKKYLHDPAQFDVDIPDDFERYWERMKENGKKGENETI